MKNQKALIRGFKKQEYQMTIGKITPAKIIADTWGHRIRQTRDTREHGLKDEVWEISTTYYYKNQQTTTKLVRDLTSFAEANGFEVQPLDFWKGTPTENTKESLHFHQGRWPNASWAIIWVSITKVESNG